MFCTKKAVLLMQSRIARSLNGLTPADLINCSMNSRVMALVKAPSMDQARKLVSRNAGRISPPKARPKTTRWNSILFAIQIENWIFSYMHKSCIGADTWEQLAWRRKRDKRGQILLRDSGMYSGKKRARPCLNYVFREHYPSVFLSYRRNQNVRAVLVASGVFVLNTSVCAKVLCGLYCQTYHILFEFN